MERDHVAVLISETHKPDALNQMVPVENRREIFCRISSVRQSEWFAAGQAGLKPQFVVKMFADDYADETIIEIDGIRYGVYRTYHAKSDQIELYLEKKGGV